MAQIIGRGAGQPRSRRPVEERRQRHLPEADAAADEVGRILLRHYGEQEWIFQIMDAVRVAVTNGVARFTQAQLPEVNEMPGGSYRFAARTREELLQNTQQAAAEGGVDPRSPFSRLRDPAADLGGATFQVDENGQLGAVVERQPQRSKKIIVPQSDEWAL